MNWLETVLKRTSAATRLWQLASVLRMFYLGRPLTACAWLLSLSVISRSCSTLTYCSCRSDTRFRWDLPPSDLHFRQLSSSRCSDTRRFYRAMLCISAHYAAERCLSVCLSHAGIVSKRLNVFSDFLLWGSSMRHFSFFSYRTLWQYSDGTPPPAGRVDTKI